MFENRQDEFCGGFGWKHVGSIFDEDEFASGLFNEGQRVLTLEIKWDGPVAVTDDECCGDAEFGDACGPVFE